MKRFVQLSPLGLALSVVAALLVLGAGSASGAFPGINGKIAFNGNETGNFDIYSVNPDGTGLTNLTNDPASDVFPAWSPNGQRIAFASRGRPGDSSREIYVMNADGTGLQRLTNNTASDTRPSWSPDGTKIVFASNRDGNFEIYQINVDGSGTPDRLTNDPGFDFAPRYSPEGEKITFESDRTGAFAVYTMRANGTGVRQITTDSMQAGEPDWAPDGNKIVFNDNECGTCSASNIFVMNANGSHVQELTAALGGNNIDARWSPNGQMITFTRNPDLVNPVADIYTMNADGTGPFDVNPTPTAGDFGSDWGTH